MKKRKLSSKELKPNKIGFRSSVSIYKEKFSNQEFIAEVKNQSSITLIGYMHKITKGLLDDYKSIGCDIILPKASITKNIKKILIEMSK